jgi:hypothetical protein
MLEVKRDDGGVTVAAARRVPSADTILGEMAAQFPDTVIVACTGAIGGACRGHRMLAQYGSNVPVPETRRILAADCPRMIEGKTHDACGIQLSGRRGLLHLTKGMAGPERCRARTLLE